MFRGVFTLGKSLNTSLLKNSKITFSTSSHTLFPITNNHSQHQLVLMRLADDFANEGHIIHSERIYKTIIEIYPTCEEAYQKLWNSWVFKRALKIPKNELDDFQKKYEKFIRPNQNEAEKKNTYNLSSTITN